MFVISVGSGSHLIYIIISGEAPKGSAGHTISYFQLRPDTRSADSIRRFWPKHKRARTHAQLASGFKTTTLTHTRIFARGHYAFIGPRGVHCCGQQLRAAKTK